MVVDELEQFGLETMSDDAMSAFLASQRYGVLGLPTDGAPYLIPISYGYDGDDAVYLTYCSGSGSRKRELTDAAEMASFLVYAVNTAYSWTSVSLAGPLRSVSADEWADLHDVLADVWQPAVLESAAFDGEVTVYALEVVDKQGVTHQGLPPAFDPQTA